LFSVFSVGKESLNTEVTETLSVLCVEALKAMEDTEKFVLVAALPRCTTIPTQGLPHG
jgi:hypothetical protein